MKKTCIWFLKAGVSAVLALAILTGFCMLYYNVPIHYDTSHGATDYAWQYNQFYSRGTEGFALGKTNNEGYVNKADYTEGQKTHILIMGSSHMEAFNVGMEESTAAVLGSLLPEKTVYNIGMSAHTFLNCADNLSAAMEKYKPTDYVILETSNLRYTNGNLQTVLEKKVSHLSSPTDGIVGMLQKNQFLRLLYAQLANFGKDDTSNKASTAPQKKTWASEELYSALITRLVSTVSQYGAKLIILYHPPLSLQEDGTATVTDDRELSAFFAEVCKESGAQFLDMAEIFTENYEKSHVLPHGFSNTSVGTGHLNKNGHKMIAQAICDLIKEGN